MNKHFFQYFFDYLNWRYLLKITAHYSFFCGEIASIILKSLAIVKTQAVSEMLVSACLIVLMPLIQTEKEPITAILADNI